MARKNGWRHSARSGPDLRPDRETRGGRVLKIWRRVSEDHTALIGGVAMDLSHSNDIPEIKLTTKLDAFVFDPRLMPRNFSDGFLNGFQFGRVVSDIQRGDKLSDKGYDVGLGELSFLSNGRTVLARLVSERLREERQTVYSILGAAGVKGFVRGEGQHRQHRLGLPTIALGNFIQPVAKSDREEIIDALTVGIEMSLITNEEIAKISLGELELRAYQPN